MEAEREETVTICDGCGSFRLCRQYDDRMWLCLKGRQCWRHRRSISKKGDK